MKNQTLLTAVVGALAASAIAGGIALASTPGEGGVIQSCYDSGGNLKVVPALPCPKGYTALAWSQQGPKGADGAPGKDGTNGTDGEDGAPGPPGKDGLNGTNGADGQDGVSVASEPEPAGANCAEGGSKFTAVNGVAYACNGATGRTGPNGEDGVSVTSATEPAGTNCVSGGSKFTSANGVTYACNGTNSSGSTGPVLTDRVGGAVLDQLHSIGGQVVPGVSWAATCLEALTSPLLVLGVGDGSGNRATSAALWESEGQAPRFLTTPAANGGSGTLVSNSSTPKQFAVFILLANGFSFELRGRATAETTGCSIVYHLTISKP